MMILGGNGRELKCLAVLVHTPGVSPERLEGRETVGHTEGESRDVPILKIAKEKVSRNFKN